MSIELLSPAGSLKAMRYAFAYGADAIYAGQPRYSLRVRNNEFNQLENLQQGISEAHALGKAFYLTVNLAPHNNKLRSYLRDMEPVIALKPDALIMSDPGLIMLTREAWPDQPVHLSVQANAVNWATVRFWQRQGISRVILSRELALEEIEDIRNHVPDMELEVFVHGALCIAYSGRCLLSGYMTHRDANQGACTNACRWQYNTQPAQETPEGRIQLAAEHAVQHVATPAEAPVFLLEETGRPGEWMPAFEDQHGTYIMNSRDLRAIQHVERLLRMGVHSLKIEGRTKSPFYVARTAQLYRRAIDDAQQGRPFDWRLMDDLEGLANRGYTEGFYRRHPPAEYQNYESGSSQRNTQTFVGEVLFEQSNAQWLTIDVKNRFSRGDLLELMTPQGNVLFTLTDLRAVRSQQPMQVAPGSGHCVQIPCPAGMTGEFGMLIRHHEPGG